MLGRPATRIELNLDRDFKEYEDAKMAMIQKKQQEKRTVTDNI